MDGLSCEWERRGRLRSHHEPQETGGTAGSPVSGWPLGKDPCEPTADRSTLSIEWRAQSLKLHTGKFHNAPEDVTITMTTPNSHHPDGHVDTGLSKAPDEAAPRSEESSGKPARSTATLLAIFALVCVGLLLLLVIGEIGIFETGN